MSLHLHLCDRNTPLYDAWSAEFSDQPLVTVHLDDFFSVEADILVSGGNSLGFMDAGLELAISLKIGPHLQERLQHLLLRQEDGVLPVGQAVSVPTDDRRWPILILAPTAYVAMDVSGTLHPYLSARAALRHFKAIDRREPKVWHMLMPGLGTGLGRVTPRACAAQMRRAYDEVVLGRKLLPKSSVAAREDYLHLCGGDEEEVS